MSQKDFDAIAKKNARTGLIVFAIFIGMVGLSFAAVPFYNMFCRLTGYAGTTQEGGTLPDQVSERTVKVQFSGKTAPHMPWEFEPEQNAIEVHIGQKAITSFRAKNMLAKPTGGTALYNVTPLKVGKYFHKIQCFCFDEQILQPYQEVDMPVLFYIDPAMNEDPNLDDVSTITLSYTFFEAESETLDQALEAFYNQESRDIKEQVTH